MTLGIVIVNVDKIVQFWSDILHLSDSGEKVGKPWIHTSAMFRLRDGL
jgi:hypothetical protein